MEFMRHIFIGLCGKSPAVITETLYQLRQSNEDDLPHEVVVITTTAGRDAIQQELFDSGVWQQFAAEIDASGERLCFGASAKHIRLLPEKDGSRDAADVIDSADNDAIANYILNVLRQFTENPETRVTFSLAGGRKNISAIGALSLSLLGRRQDRLCHVLVNPPFDLPHLQPKFYYPSDRWHYLPDGQKVHGHDAVISLGDIPFARCRYLFNDRLNQLPGDFLETVDRINGKIAENLDAPELFLKPDTLECHIDEIALKFRVTEFVAYWLLAQRCKNGCPPIRGQEEMLREFSEFAASINSMVMPEIIHYAALEKKTTDDIRRIISSLSRKIRDAVPIDRGRNFCLPARDRGVYGILLPPANITCPRNY